MGSKRKSQCTPEEWAEIRRKDRERYHANPTRKAKMLAYGREYSKSPRGRAKDKARYNERRKKLIADAARKRKYGITPEQFDALWLVQNGNCAVCASSMEREGKGSKHCHVDHDHASGRVRGLLCGRCNVAEGFILSLGLTPHQFADKVQGYLDSPPSNSTEGVLW
jgi:hypothetical protein